MLSTGKWIVVTRALLSVARSEGNRGLVTITKRRMSRYTLHALSSSPTLDFGWSAVSSTFSPLTKRAAMTMTIIESKLPMIAGDSAPIYKAAAYWLPNDTAPTTSERMIFLSRASLRLSAIYTIINGMMNISGANCSTIFAARVFTSRPVSLASTITGVPMAPKVVATLLAIRHTTAEKIGF